MRLFAARDSTEHGSGHEAETPVAREWRARVLHFRSDPAQLFNTTGSRVELCTLVIISVRGHSTTLKSTAKGVGPTHFVG